MNKFLFSVLVIVFGAVASANDGGMAYIDVQGIAPVKEAKSGTEIKFYGKDAANFMRLLPGYANALYFMLPEVVANQLEMNERGVAIVSNGWNLMFTCRAGKVDIDFENPQDATFVSEQPECTISLNKNYEPGSGKADLGDTWSMEPKDYSNMCK